MAPAQNHSDGDARVAEQAAFGRLIDVGKAFPPSTRHADKIVALADVSYSLRRGELVALLGPSGCGKTTLLRIVGGLTHCSAGRVEIAGS